LVSYIYKSWHSLFVSLRRDAAPSRTVRRATITARSPPPRRQDRYQWYRHKIEDLIDRFEDHGSIPATLRAFVPRDPYVLGCAAHDVEKRALGRRLRDVHAELTKGAVVGA
jgi:hypothetical protein